MRRQGTKRRMGHSILSLAILVGLMSIQVVSCNKNSLEGMIVAVELPDGAEATFEETRLIAMDPNDPDKSPRILSKDFHSACSPVLSNNGRYLIFSGKQQQGDSWQIWRMDLQKRSTSQVTDLPEDCSDPTFLPDGQVVFSKSGTLKDTRVSTLYKCHMDGTGLQQLTFHPHNDYAPSVLMDGRILYTSSQQYPDKKEPVFLIMLPDGSKSDLFYTGNKGAFPISSGTESVNGDIYFIENYPQNQGGGRLVVIHQNRPLHSYRVLSDGLEGAFHSVVPFSQSVCLVSYRSTSDSHYALYEFDTGEQELLGKVCSAEGNVVDPVVVRAQKRPRILPSAVDPENPTGLLMTQNINHSMVQANEPISGDTVANRIQVIGLEGLMGETEVEEDGSFYLKIDADTPVRLITMNQNGEVIRGPSDWIWLRPNERRGCVGCHADPELAPENRVPLAVKHPPFIVSSAQKGISKLEESAK